MDRRSFVGGMTTATVSALSGCSSLFSRSDPSIEPLVTDADWQTFGHDIQNTNTTPSAPPTPPITQDWVFSTRGNISTRPLVTKDIVILGDSKGYVYGIDQNTGRKQWQFQTKKLIGDYYISTTPLIRGNSIYVASSDWHLYALNMESGQKRWAKRIGEILTPLIGSQNTIIGA
ncbi:MAG: PQQ-binding-like beta-propeller repeat protein, partial [Halobacteriaceae archaeon]